MTFAHSCAAVSVLLFSAAGAAWSPEPGAPTQDAGTQDGPLTPAALQQRMVEAAGALLGRLDEAHRDAARAPWEDPERRTWAFGPVQREGLAIGGLSPEDFAAVETLLATALSPKGVGAWHEIRELENVLRERESTPERIATHRDPDLYWLRVYGTPKAGSPWSWRFEGHHLALHVSCLPDAYPTVTPYFLGANPLFTDDDIGPETPARVALFQELNDGLQGLLRTMDEEQSMAAMGQEAERPGDVRMGPGSTELPEAMGLEWRDLSEDARENLVSLFDVYLSTLTPELRRYSLSADDKQSEEVRFARWGGTGIAEARTWAIVAPTFALELATTDGPHHVHIVLRDVERDFGGK